MSLCLGGKGEVVLGGKHNVNVGALTMQGDIDLGANLLKTTNLAMKEGTSSQMYIRSRADDAYRRMKVSRLIATAYIEAEGDNTVDLGSSSVELKNAYFDGTLRTDGIILDQALKATRIVTKTANYTTLGTDHLILLDSSGGAFTVTLLPVASALGQYLIFKKISADANAITLDGDGAETIDGALTNTDIDAQYDMLIIYAGNSEWHIVGRFIS